MTIRQQQFIDAMIVGSFTGILGGAISLTFAKDYFLLCYTLIGLCSTISYYGGYKSCYGIVQRVLRETEQSCIIKNKQENKEKGEIKNEGKDSS